MTEHWNEDFAEPASVCPGCVDKAQMIAHLLDYIERLKLPSTESLAGDL